MRKNARIIQISGLRGLIFTLFVIICLIMGFVGFPGLVAMCIWNMVSNAVEVIPQINVFQGVLLWVIVALSIYVFNRDKSFVELKRPSQLSESEIKDLMEKIRTQAQAHKINSMLLKTDELKDINKVNELEDSSKEKDKEKL